MKQVISSLLLAFSLAPLSAYAQTRVPGAVPPVPVGAPLQNPYVDRSVASKIPPIPTDGVSIAGSSKTGDREDELTTQELEAFENLVINSIVPGQYARAQIVRNRNMGGMTSGAGSGVGTSGVAGVGGVGGAASASLNAQQLITIPHARMFLYRGMRLIADIGVAEISIYLAKGGKRDTLVWTGQLSGIGLMPSPVPSTPYTPPLTAGKPLVRDSTPSSSASTNNAASAGTNTSSNNQ